MAALEHLIPPKSRQRIIDRQLLTKIFATEPSERAFIWDRDTEILEEFRRGVLWFHIMPGSRGLDPRKEEI